MPETRPVSTLETPNPPTAPENDTGPAIPPPNVQPHVSAFNPSDTQATAPAPALQPSGSPLAPRPRRRAAPSTSDAHPNAILEIVSALPIYSDPDDSVTSAIIPDSLAMFSVVNTMDTLMTSTHRFLQGAPIWHPVLSHLYFGMLFFFQTLRAQREAGELFPETRNLLLQIEHYFDFRSLAIPGPLVHFFSALSVAAPADDIIGNASVGLPADPKNSGSSGYLLSNNMWPRLPNIQMLLDVAYRQVYNRQQAPPPGCDYDFSSLFGSALDSNTRARFHLRTPNYWNLSDVPQQIWESCHNTRRQMKLPTAMNLNTTTFALSWIQWLRLAPIGNEILPDWFSPIITVMQRYCGFFKGSRSLNDITVTGNGAIFVQITYAGDTRKMLESDPAPETVVTKASSLSPSESEKDKKGKSKDEDPKSPTTIRTPTNTPSEIVRLPGLTSYLKHNHRNLPALHLQIGALTQVNADDHGHFANSVVRTGPAWDVRPYYQRSEKFNYSRIIGGNLVDNYHQDTRS
ncbi:putative coat protein [Lichen partiti-like RNA virus 2]|nr:putative coat protein [Lichen partiti-like RNA virus 2]